MKVVFLARRYLPHIGGVELHIQKLVEKFGPDIQVTIVTEQHTPELALKETIESATVYRIPLPNQQTNKFVIWWWWFRHLNLVFSADIVHIHDVFFWTLPFRWFFFWKPFFMTFHGYEGTRNPKWQQIFWHQMAEVSTSGNLCIGGFHEKWYGVTPNQISYGATDVENHKVKISSSTLRNKPTIKVVFVGRLAADTGILVYIEALKILELQFKLTLDVFGDGPDRQIAEEYVKQYQLPVTFHGFVSQDKILWEKYDVAFVSRYLAILEAFVAGLPVIAQYNVEIKKDYLELTPFKNWLVTAQSTQQIVEGFEAAVKSSNSEPLQLAQSWAEKQTWQKMCETYLELWKFISNQDDI